jgi:hypothetical protein
MQTVIRMLPEPGPDGLRRVRIHFFVHDDKGPAKTPAGAVMSNWGPFHFPGSVGFIACKPKQSNITPQVVAGTVEPTVHSNDARAVTCPECMATDAYKDMMKRLAELVTS